MDNKSVPTIVPDWVWIDGQQAMEILNIKQGALKYLRDTGKISYSSLEVKSKLYYDVIELRATLESNRRRKK